LEAIARAGIFVFGIVMAIIGAVVPALLEPLGLTLGDVGALFLAMNFAMLVASLVLGLVVDRFGLKVPLATGAALVAIALVLIARAGSYPQLLAAAACLGLGGGAVNGASNTLVADLHEDPRRKGAALNRLGVFFGFGALLLPFGLGAVSSTIGMGGLLVAAATLCAIIAASASALTFPPPKQRQGWPLAQMPRFVRMPVVLMLAGLLFLQSGNEFLLGGYLATFLTQELHVSTAAASYALGSYWAGIMVARIALGRLLLRVTGTAVVLASALLSAASSVWIAVAVSPAMGVAGAALAGLAIAGIFPTVLSVAATRFPAHSGTVFGILLTVALAGGMTIPWLGGQLADALGIRVVFGLAALNFLGIGILMLGVRRTLDRPPTTSRQQAEGPV
jgi:MFS transporter, FHS family, glucose/mannose:H+ symporter